MSALILSSFKFPIAIVTVRTDTKVPGKNRVVMIAMIFKAELSRLLALASFVKAKVSFLLAFASFVRVELSSSLSLMSSLLALRSSFESSLAF